MPLHQTRPRHISVLDCEVTEKRCGWISEIIWELECKSTWITLKLLAVASSSVHTAQETAGFPGLRPGLFFCKFRANCDECQSG